MSAEPIVNDPRVLELLREAAEWRLLGLLLESPGPEWRAQVAALAEEVADADLKEAAVAARQEAGETLYHTTFGPGGPAAPREVSYRGRTLPGPFLAELLAFYEAFAYQPASLEAPDHIAVEAGFLGYLRFKEAYAVARGEQEQAAVTRDAAARFIDEHLATVAEPLARSLDASGIRYLSLTVAAIFRRVGPPRAAGSGYDQPVSCVDEGCASKCEQFSAGEEYDI